MEEDEGLAFMDHDRVPLYALTVHSQKAIQGVTPSKECNKKEVTNTENVISFLIFLFVLFQSKKLKNSKFHFILLL
jgi:hypothetical protein